MAQDIKTQEIERRQKEVADYDFQIALFLSALEQIKTAPPEHTPADFGGMLEKLLADNRRERAKSIVMLQALQSMPNTWEEPLKLGEESAKVESTPLRIAS